VDALDTPEIRYAKWLLSVAIKNGECLDCHFVPISAGYSYVRTGGRDDPRERAHRYIYRLLKEPIPEYMFVLHKCDNRRCINPDHLFIGTAQDNMIRKGRHRFMRHDTRKVTVELERKMLTLRRNGETIEFIANRFSLHPSTVRDYVCEGGRRYGRS